MVKTHHYSSTTVWTGNTGSGTKNYTSYERSHVLQIEGKAEISCSSDAPFRGDVSKHNPEDFFLASFASCHMLCYLHRCADAGIVVLAYTDTAKGTLEQSPEGPGRFTSIHLYPVVVIEDAAQKDLAESLHILAHQDCFMANSVNFPVSNHPTINLKP